MRSSSAFLIPCVTTGVIVLMLWLADCGQTENARDHLRFGSATSSHEPTPKEMALYVVTWTTDVMPAWDPKAEQTQFLSLPWRGLRKEDLEAALRDPTAKVEFLGRTQVEEGQRLVWNRTEPGQMRSMNGDGWSMKNVKWQYSYIVHPGRQGVRVSQPAETWSPGGHAASPDPEGTSWPARTYRIGVHELVKMPSGKFERRVSVLAME